VCSYPGGDRLLREACGHAANGGTGGTESELRNDVACKLMEYANRCKRLIDHIWSRDRGAYPKAEASELAFDIIGRCGGTDRAERNKVVRLIGIERIDLGVRPYEASRRLDEPVVVESEVVAR